tara:strand:+ start:638 stop:1501 length:864 start_codon:yes stop_codon:yes gene_type:complete
MTVAINVNGRIADKEKAVISIFDHGFLYGEGIYETLRTYRRRPFLFDRHMVRLRQSADMLTLNVPFSDSEIATELQKTMSAATIRDEAYIRILLTRGIGDLTYDPRDTPKPSLVIIVKDQIDPPQAAYQEGVNVVITKVVRNHPSTVNPKIKSNNLLNSALAMQEAIRRGAFEGVMRNYKGELTECTTANLFIVTNNTAVTPPIEAGLLPGITRAFLFEVAKDTNIIVKEEVLKDEDLFNAEEAFLTSTTRELVPIVKVDGNKIGDGSPGPITKKLLEAFRVRAHAA